MPNTLHLNSKTDVSREQYTASQDEDFASQLKFKTPRAQESASRDDDGI